MEFANYFYMVFLTVAFCVVYAGLLFFFPYFFEKRKVVLSRRSIISLVWIAGLSLLAYFVSYNISDQQLGNRILHAFGGGFLALLTSFFAARDSKVQITKFQFFVMSLLLVTSLGVANELAEFVMQTVTGTMFTDSLIDTWLDLTSNTVGLLLASAIGIPLLHAKKRQVVEPTVAAAESVS